jgi:hypothetical protein
MSILDSGARLRGRCAECLALDRLVELARAGRSGVVDVLRRMAGVGKPEGAPP